MFRAKWLTVVIVLGVACGEQTDTSDPVVQPRNEECLWFQQCGTAANGAGCGTCDDGNKCTEDRCVNGYTCAYVPLANTCDCEPNCGAPEGRLSPFQAVSLGDGGLDGLLGLVSSAVTANGQWAYLAARDNGVVSTLVRVSGVYQWADTTELKQVLAVALSTDEKYLYAMSPEQLKRYLRDPSTGRLIDTGVDLPGGQGLAVAPGLVGVVNDGEIRILAETGTDLALSGTVADGVLGNAQQLAFSPDGKHIYAPSWEDNGVNGWSVAGSSLVSVGGVTDKRGLNRAQSLAISPDGERVYVAGFCDHDVAILSRNTKTGELLWEGSAWSEGPSLSDCWIDNPAPDGRIARPTSLSVSPNGDFLAVGGGSLGAPDVAVLSIKGANLEPYSLVDENTEAEPVAMAAFDFVAAQWGDNKPDSLELLRGSTHVVFGSDQLYATSVMTNAFEVITVEETSAPSVQTLQQGQGGVWGIAGGHELDISPDGRHLYVAPRNQYAVGVFGVDLDTGGITPLPSPALPAPPDDEPGVIPHVIVVGESGDEVVAGDAINGVLHLFDRDTQSGELTHKQALMLPECLGHKVFIVGIRASKDTKHFYVSDFQVEEKSCLLHVVREGGELKAAEIYTEEFLRGIEGFELTSDGKHVYTANHISGTVGHYKRNVDTGTLEAQPAVEREDLMGAEFMAISPNQKYVYVASPRVDDLVTFERDLSTGQLKYLETFVTIPGDDGPKLGGASGLVLSRDGKWLYQTAHHSDAINVFSVAETGFLNLIQVVKGMDSLLWVNGVRTSLDDRFVYTVSLQASAVSVFKVHLGSDDGCGGLCPAQ